MRDQRQATGGLLVELGGWFDHLASAELAAISGRRSVLAAPRLAKVSDVAVSDLVRLGCGRYVLLDLGSSDTPSKVPEGVEARLSGSYAVRFRDPRGALSEVDRRTAISSAWRAHPAPRVQLRNPDQDLFVYVTEDGLHFGELIGVCAPELRSTPVRRPFTRSYEMPPRKARVLVNLSGATPGTPFFDPCCGTGALVIEAARVGCAAFGGDLEIRATGGSAVNAAFDGVDAMIVAADGGAPPVRPGRIRSVASDLPYGRSATRRGLSSRELYHHVLSGLRSPVAVGGRAVLMAADEGDPVAEHDGWELESHIVEDARTVVRSIITWRRVEA